MTTPTVDALITAAAAGDDLDDLARAILGRPSRKAELKTFKLSKLSGGRRRIEHMGTVHTFASFDEAHDWMEAVSDAVDAAL